MEGFSIPRVPINNTLSQSFFGSHSGPRGYRARRYSVVHSEGEKEQEVDVVAERARARARERERERERDVHAHTHVDMYRHKYIIYIQMR